MQHLYFIVQCTYGYECACACDSPMVVVMQSPEIKQWSWRVRGGWNSILHLLSLLFCTFHFNTNGCRCVLCGETTKVTFSVCEWKSRVGKTVFKIHICARRNVMSVCRYRFSFVFSLMRCNAMHHNTYCIGYAKWNACLICLSLRNSHFVWRTPSLCGDCEF